MKKQLRNISRILFLIGFILIVINGNMVLWLGIFLISLLLAFGFGRFYCGWICPMNTVMKPAEWISKKFNWQTDKVPTVLRSTKIGWLMLIVMLFSMVVAKRQLGINIPILLLFLVLSFFVTLRYRPEVFHNKICPFGVLLSLTGRFAYYSERVTPDQCTGCYLCEKSCPSSAVKVTDMKAKVDSMLCHQCLKCAIVCPTDAISYQSKNSLK